MTDAAAAHRGFTGLGRGDIVRPEELVSVTAYRAEVLASLPGLEAIELRSADALGLVLAAEVHSEEPIPSFANSSMDGYAVVAADIAEASEESPVQLEVVGEVAAGTADLPDVGPGSAVRIMTGAPMPAGADSVVPVEVTREERRTVRVFRPGRAGEFVRTVGQDVRPGQLLLPAGHRIRPADIGLLAATGVHRVRCHPSPRVVLLSTGDEIVASDRQPGPGQIRDANGPMLSSLVRQVGGVPYVAGIVRDDHRALAEAIDTNLGHADAVIVTGGISAGAHDHLHDVVAQLGEVSSYRVAMQPGMPQLHGRIGDVPIFGLPGNPVSAFVSFEVFVRPALRSLQGRRDLDRPVVQATLTEDVTSPPHKRSFIRVRLHRGEQGWEAAPTGAQGSHLLTSIVRADGLAEIPEDVTTARAGERVAVRLLVDG